jgi:DNA replication and repair protein RecF
LQSAVQPVATLPAAGGPVAVLRLALTDFRCYRALKLETDGRPVVLTGPNGAGKTNVLEALSFLSPGRGLRRARLSEVGRRASPAEAALPWAVAATVLSQDGPVAIGTGLEAGEEGERRAVRIDGAPQRGQTGLGELVAAVWFAPEMERLFAEGPGQRRRFLDRLVFGFDPAHAGRLQRYERAIRERGRILADAREQGRGADPAWLEGIEQTLAETGIAIAAARGDTVARLNAACDEGIGPFPAALLRVNGEVERWLDSGPALAAEDRLRAALAASRAQDAETGGAAAGPHRSDLSVVYAARGVPAAQCSTGEQKALLLSIILANARLVALARNRAPLLLLDEVVSHLDAARRAALFDEIRALGAQAWLTGTDAAVFAPLARDAQHFRVDNAVITA